MHAKTGCLAEVNQLVGPLSTMPDSAADLLGFGSTFAVITAPSSTSITEVGSAELNGRRGWCLAISWNKNSRWIGFNGKLAW
jgi:hypothetical protein